MYIPHRPQAQVLRSDKHAQVVLSGRGWGATICGVLWAWQQATLWRRHVKWLTAPSQRMGHIWEMIQVHSAPTDRSLAKINVSGGFALKFSDGGSIEIVLAQHVDRIREADNVAYVIDQATTVPSQFWYACLEAAKDRDARALIMGSKEHNNGKFAKFYAECTDLFFTNKIDTFTFWTKDNPYHSASALDDARKTMSAQAYRDTFEPSAVHNPTDLPNWEALVEDCMSTYNPGGLGEPAIMSIVRDIDETIVILLGKASGKMLEHITLPRYLTFDQLVPRLLAINLNHQGGVTNIVVEANSTGAPFADNLSKHMRARAVHHTAEITNALYNAIEQKEVRLLDVFDLSVGLKKVKPNSSVAALALAWDERGRVWARHTPSSYT